MVFRIVVGVVARVIAKGDEVYQHLSSARLSLEESALTSMRVDRFFLRVEGKNPASPWQALLESALTSMRVDRFFLRVEQKNPASPWRASLESANLAIARLYGFLRRADEEPTSSMER
jgi:hypothetical protein